MPVPINPELHSTTTTTTTTTTTMNNTNEQQEQLPSLPKITSQDINNCALSSWYNQFRTMTFRSKILPLTSEFINYLNADGIFLPEEGQPQAAATIEEIDSSDEEEDDDDDNTNTPNYPEIESFIRESIQNLGGAVFPKLTWSSPRDAAWIAATQSLKCTSPFDVFLLLKSSDFVNHDLNHAFEHCSDEEAQQQQQQQQHYLVLRKWQDLQPSMEFRVFIKNKEIIAISQRDLAYYDFLEEMKDDIENMIFDSFEDHVQQVFSNNNYVMDVYIERQRRKVWIIDFNPFTPATDGLLFEWSELAQLKSNQEEDNEHADEPEFRTILSEVEANTHVCSGPRFATNMVPRDMIDLSDGRTVAEFAEEFQRAMMLTGTQQDDSSSDDDDDEEEKRDNNNNNER